MSTKTQDQKGTLINLVFNIPDQELDYILSGCFEGGSNYWVSKIAVKDNDFCGAEYASESVSKGATLLVTENCNEVGCEVVIHELDKRKLLVGIKNYMEQERDVDMNSWDGNSYDMILQYALFNKQKYS